MRKPATKEDSKVQRSDSGGNAVCKKTAFDQTLNMEETA